jgi:uncharacterized membrane protein
LKLSRKTPPQKSIMNLTDTTDTTNNMNTTKTRTVAKIDLDLDLDLDRLDVLSGHLGLGVGLLSAAITDLLGAVIVVLLNGLRTVLHLVEVQDEDLQAMIPVASFPTVSARSGKSARSTSERWVIFIDH